MSVCMYASTCKYIQRVAQSTDRQLVEIITAINDGRTANEHYQLEGE